MSIVKINALDIPSDAGDVIISRFTARMNSLSEVPGFLGFELLRPTSEAEKRWFVYTRWTDQAAYEAWRDGDGARNAHAGGSQGAGSGQPGPDGEAKPADGEQAPPQRPVSMGATLLEFEVEVSAGPSGL